MKQFKKKTIALVLASVVTVVGAFGAENYKNSLMALQLDNTENGAVNLTVLTKQDYANSISAVRKDANTYVIMLPETNSQMKGAARLVSNIDSVNVSTMPYTTSSKGYTKITIKTSPNTVLNASKGLFIPEQHQGLIETTAQQPEQPKFDEPRVEEKYTPQPEVRQEAIRSRSGVDQINPVDIRQSVKQFEQSPQTSEPERNNSYEEPSSPDEDNAPIQNPEEEQGPSSWTFIGGLILIAILMVLLVVRAKSTMREIIGEQTEFDFDDEEDAKKKKKKEAAKKQSITKINKAVKSLDKKYTKPDKMPVNVAPQPAPEIEEPEVEEAPTIVDLDEIFQETKQSPTPAAEEAPDEDFNADLEDFLAGFSFDEEDEEEVEEGSGYDEELYEKYISDEELKFSKDDVDKINQLLNSEINDDTLKNITDYITVPVVEKKRTPAEVLEDLVTTYSIDQNIVFTGSDIEALNKLISVEIDSDFITDLKTDPDIIKRREEEIAKSKDKPHKTSELLTLNVKDMLPDLSEALKKQGGRKIESDAKPEVVYFSEGYDVSILSLKDKLPDLSLEINNKDAYKTRPSDAVEYSESGYDVQKMTISGLPDLRDVLKNPEKYETKEPEPVLVDEEALLKNISNVTFKPFDDGSRDFEIINEFDDSNAPSISDMQKEFDQFSDIQIVNDDELEVQTQREYDDFESLYDNSFVDLDNKTAQELDKELNDMMEELPKLKKPAPKKLEPKRDYDSDKLLQFIQEKRAEREIKREKEKPEPQQNAQSGEKEFCTVRGEEYEILCRSDFDGNMGCCLGKNSNGYTVIGYAGDRTFKIKHYVSLKSEQMQARASEKMADGTTRYIVRLGVHKFIMNAKDDNLEFVMDLC